MDKFIGKKLINVSDEEEPSDAYSHFKSIIALTFEDQSKFFFGHYQSCCEHVRIADGLEDLKNAIGQYIVSYEEYSNEEEDDYFLYRYTFYKFRFNKSDVTLRFIGKSNGYYSVSVDTVEEFPDDH